MAVTRSGPSGTGHVPASAKAIAWALNLAPVPADRPPGVQVLVGLANRLDGAFPSVATLRYTDLSERTVRTCLDRLQADRIIAPCDTHNVSARIKRADRRPGAGT